MSQAAAPDRFDGPLAEYLAEAPVSDEIDGGAVVGWFGLYRNHDLPGGAVLHRDREGFVTAWYSPSDAKLDHRWAEIRDAIQAILLDPLA